MAGNRPLHTISYGMIRVTIWPHAAETCIYYDVVPARTYRTQDGEWKDSHSFGESDVPLLVKALKDAHTWIQTRKSIDDLDLALPPPPGRTDGDAGCDN